MSTLFSFVKEVVGETVKTVLSICAVGASSSTALALAFRVIEFASYGTIHADTTFERNKEARLTFSTVSGILALSTVTVTRVALSGSSIQIETVIADSTGRSIGAGSTVTDATFALEVS